MNRLFSLYNVTKHDYTITYREEDTRSVLSPEKGNIMKFTKTSAKQLTEFMAIMDKDGCVPSSEWVSGRYATKHTKALPPFVIRFERKEYSKTNLPKHDTPERTAYWYFQKNTRRRVVLVLDKEAAMNFFFEAAKGKEY